jgi:hypothetical protein
MTQIGQIIGLFFLFAAFTGLTQAAETIDLSPQMAEDVVRVAIDLSAGGHALVQGRDADQTDSQERQLPMSVAARIEYLERRLALPATANSQGTILAARYYDRAEATLKVDDSGRKPRLSDERRFIVLESTNERPILYCPDGPLTREQLDLIDIVGNSYFLEHLLPSQPVALGESWTLEASAIGPLLTIDRVAVCEVQSVLEEYNKSFAKIRLAGTVHGMTDGAATEQEVRGVYLFNRKLGRVVQLNLAVREKRSIGSATPGLDAVAKLQMTIEPAEAPQQLGDEAITQLRRAQRSAKRDLTYEAESLGFRFHHDRQWFVTGEQRKSITLRRVEGGDLVAQCTLTTLPPKSAGRQTSLEQFEKDVIFALGKNFGELVSNRRWQNAAGHYCYAVVARGLIDEVPVEWHYYLVAPESGHRVSAVVTIEKPMVERLGDADLQIVESLQLFPPIPAAETAGPSSPKTQR